MLYVFDDIGRDEEANCTASDYAQGKIREIVADPKAADLLTPNSYSIGTKRVRVDADYRAAYNRDNVRLVDIRSAPIETVTEHCIRNSCTDARCLTRCSAMLPGWSTTTSVPLPR